ncbi:MAG TPA: hypothetical protein PKZ16_02390 [bacterium]|nr:hypothetical protein [bacterium]HPL95828.1 hypothetical protein [bacterium]
MENRELPSSQMSEEMLEKQRQELIKIVGELEEILRKRSQESDRKVLLHEKTMCEIRLFESLNRLKQDCQFLEQGVPVVHDKKGEPVFDFTNEEGENNTIKQKETEMKFSRIVDVFGVGGLNLLEHHLDVVIAKKAREIATPGVYTEGIKLWSQEIHRLWSVKKKIGSGIELVKNIDDNSPLYTNYVIAYGRLNEDQEQQQKIINEGYFTKEDLIIFSEALDLCIKEHEEELKSKSAEHRRKRIEGDLFLEKSLKEKIDRFIENYK